MFVKIIRKSTLMTFFMVLGSVFFAGMLLSWPNAASTGISRGLSICSSLIIPSLFPFLVLAGFTTKSGVGHAIGRRLEFLTRLLFGLPGCCATGILIGFIGGYPSGALAVGELVQQGAISKAQGRRMLCFCVNGGPAFIISGVGAGMMGSIRYGVMLYAAHIAAALLLGIALRVLAPLKETENQDRKNNEMRVSLQRMPPAAAFVESVATACRTMLTMCGFIVLFASLMSLIDASGFTHWFQTAAQNLFHVEGNAKSFADIVACILPGLLEVSSGSIEAARAGAAAPLMLGMTLGWASLSVHCQVAASLQGQRLMGTSYFLARIFHALLGGLLSVMLFRWIPFPVVAFNPSTDAIVVPYSTSAAASAALLILCALFLLTVTIPSTSSTVRKLEYSQKEKNML